MPPGRGRAPRPRSPPRRRGRRRTRDTGRRVCRRQTAYDPTMRHRKTKASGLKPTVRARAERREPEAAQLEQLERPEHRGEAERVRVLACEQRRRGEHAEDARRPERIPPPFPQRDRGEEHGRGDGGGEDERQVPDERGREVVQEAVRGERVRARVPEVVPDQRAVADEECPVQVNRSIPRGRPDGEHEPCEDGGQRSGEQQLATGREAAEIGEACSGRAHSGNRMFARNRVGAAGVGTNLFSPELRRSTMSTG